MAKIDPARVLSRGARWRPSRGPKPHPSASEYKRIAVQSGCSVQMLMSVERHGQGPKPSPERLQAYEALRAARWVP